MDSVSHLEKSDVSDPLKHLFSLDLERTSPVLDEVTEKRLQFKPVKKVRFADQLIVKDINYVPHVNDGLTDTKSILKSSKVAPLFTSQLDASPDNSLLSDIQESSLNERIEDDNYSLDSFDNETDTDTEDGAILPLEQETIPNEEENVNAKEHNSNLQQNSYIDELIKDNSLKNTDVLSDDEVLSINSNASDETIDINGGSTVEKNDEKEKEILLIDEKISPLSIIDNKDFDKVIANIKKKKLNRHLNTCLGFPNNKKNSRLRKKCTNASSEETLNKKLELSLLQSKQTLELNSLLVKDSVFSAAELKSSVFRAWHTTKDKRQKKIIKDVPLLKEENTEKMSAEEAYKCWKKSKEEIINKRKSTKPHILPPTLTFQKKKVQENESEIAFKFWKKKKDEINQQKILDKQKKEEEERKRCFIDKEIKKKDAELAFNAWNAQKMQANEFEKKKNDLYRQKEKEKSELKAKRDDDAQAMYNIWLHSKAISSKISISKPIRNKPPWTPPGRS